MNQTDKAGFKELFDGLAEYYRQDELGKIALQINFGALEQYSLEQISQAASLHVQNTKSGQFFPRAADLITRLEGGDISPDMIIAAAKLAQTPLGCLCRIHIGSYDLDTRDAFYLRQRAEECIQKLPEWRTQAKTGQYSDHSISIMLKYGVAPETSLFNGLSGPKDVYHLLERVDKISKSKRHLELIAPPELPTENNQDHSGAIIEKLTHQTQGMKS